MAAFDMRKNISGMNSKIRVTKNSLVSCCKILYRVELISAFNTRKKHKWHEFANRGHKKLATLLAVNFYRIKLVTPFHTRRFHK